MFFSIIIIHTRLITLYFCVKHISYTCFHGIGNMCLMTVPTQITCNQPPCQVFFNNSKTDLIMGAPVVNNTLFTPVFYILSDDMNSCYSCTFYYYPTIHYDTISLLQSRHMIMLFILASHLPSLIMDHPVVVFSLHTQFTHLIWLVFPLSMYSGSVLALFLPSMFMYLAHSNLYYLTRSTVITV